MSERDHAHQSENPGRSQVNEIVQITICYLSFQDKLRWLMDQAREAVQFWVKGKQQQTRDKSNDFHQQRNGSHFRLLKSQCFTFHEQKASSRLSTFCGDELWF
jgi:hypothetical protein